MLNFSKCFNLDYCNTSRYFKIVDKQSLDVNKVVEDLKIDLNTQISSWVNIVCRHMTTVTNDGLESLKNKGILDLKRMLQEETSLSNFLKSHGITIDVDRKIFNINNNEYPILSYSDTCPFCISRENDEICTGYYRCELKENIEHLALKLYKYGATIEFFINGTLEEMMKYSTIDKYPEILFTIEEICSLIPDEHIKNIHLGNQWIKNENKCYIVEFSTSLSDMETYAPIDYNNSYTIYSDALFINGYDFDDYMDRKIPQNVFDNIALIQWFIDICFFDREKYGSLLPDKCVDKQDIKITKVI